jgi:hypothetical protein
LAWTFSSWLDVFHLMDLKNCNWRKIYVWRSGTPSFNLFHEVTWNDFQKEGSTYSWDLWVWVFLLLRWKDFQARLVNGRLEHMKVSCGSGRSLLLSFSLMRYEQVQSVKSYVLSPFRYLFFGSQISWFGAECCLGNVQLKDMQIFSVF